jgi:hypothetical protein
MVLRLEYHHKLRICKDTTCIEIEKEEIRELVKLLRTVISTLREEFVEDRWFAEEEREEEESPLARLFKF